MTTTTTTASNVLNHQSGQHVECWGYLRTEILARGVVTGWFWTHDDDGAELIGEPYKVYRIALTGGGETRSVHADTYPDHDATRAALDAWRRDQAIRRLAGETPARCVHCRRDVEPDSISGWVDDSGKGDCPMNPESINHETEQDR